MCWVVLSAGFVCVRFRGGSIEVLWGRFSNTVLYYLSSQTAKCGGKIFFRFADFCSVFVRVFAFVLPIELLAVELNNPQFKQLP